MTPPAERPITENSDQVDKSGFLDRISGSSMICPDGNRAWKFAAERRGIPVQGVVHQVKNFTSEGLGVETERVPRVETERGMLGSL